ncbi:NAD(P)/FAD-dependent oxidoreductase [Thalassobaculum sp.]|uniref:NAD(P)/FAD-dependent oxidoreductase n=1 Tax=Thalassobaculum sp. TaxID=2022740 RepID=UPI003B599963
MTTTTNNASPNTADILIIGGGMAGASAGYFMADGAKVILLERESQPGYHTTGRSAALFFENYGNATIRKLNKATRPFLESPPEGFATDPLMTPRGAVAVATEELLGTLAKELEQSPSMERVDGKTLFEIAPYLDPDRIVAGAYEAGAMDMDVHAILQGFLRGLRAKGGRVVTDAEVMGLSRAGGTWSVETRAGTFSAPIVVNAAGAWCDVVGEMAGAAPIGLIPKRRTAFTFDVALRDGTTADPSSWAMADLCDESWYVRPEGGRMMGSPADEIPSPPTDAQPEIEDVAMAIDKIQTDTLFVINRPHSTWAGLRSFVADKSPVVGFAPAAEGFLWVAGQGGYGIQTSAAMGRFSAALALGRAVPEDMVKLGLTKEELAPDRPGLGRK